jgi:hypothetical protein
MCLKELSMEEMIPLSDTKGDPAVYIYIYSAGSRFCGREQRSDDLAYLGICASSSKRAERSNDALRLIKSVCTNSLVGHYISCSRKPCSHKSCSRKPCSAVARQNSFGSINHRDRSFGLHSPVFDRHRIPWNGHSCMRSVWPRANPMSPVTSFHIRGLVWAGQVGGLLRLPEHAPL